MKYTSYMLICAETKEERTNSSRFIVVKVISVYITVFHDRVAILWSCLDVEWNKKEGSLDVE